MTPSHEISGITPADSTVGSAVPDRDGTVNRAGRPAKRRRINFACNYCRSRKTRCDEQKPSCMACINAGIECITTDRRRPGVEVSRRETQRRASRASTSSLATATPTGRLNSSPVPRDNIIVGEGHDRDAVRVETGSTPAEGPRYEDDDPRTPPEPERSKFQGKLPVFRPCHGSNSVEILADWLDLASRRLGLHHSRGLPSGSRKQPTLLRNAIISSSDPCCFPPAHIAHNLASRFFDGINVLFPLLSRGQSEQDLGMAHDLGPRAFAEARGIAALAEIYCIWTIGFAAEPRLDSLFDPREYLDYCKTLLGHLVVFNSVENVRAIVLLAICLDTYDDCAGAYNTFSLGASMAMTLGLHQLSSGRHRGIHSGPDLTENDERRRLWLAIYAYEKLLSFELSRPSLVRDDDCYPPDACDFSKDTFSQESTGRKACVVILDLARVLGEIGRKSVLVSRKEELVSGRELQAVIAEKVQTVAESTLRLTRWAETVPDEFRPTSDLVTDSNICPFSSYIVMHYNNALLILSRNTLLISKEAMSAVADTIAKDKPWGSVVRNGQSIAANAARRILRILVETLDSQSNSIFSSWLGMLHAFATLAVYIFTHPGSRISTMDFHLMQAATDFLRGVGSRMCDEETLNALLQKIDNILAQQDDPSPALLATYSNSSTCPTSGSGQGLNSASRSRPAHNRASGTNATYDVPEAELLNLNDIIPGTSDLGFDSLYSAMSILGDGWPPGMPDGMGMFLSGPMA